MTGTVAFTVLVAGGNRDQVAFDSYSSQLVAIVDMLALEVAGEIDSSSQENGQTRNRRQRRNLIDIQVDSTSYSKGQRRLAQHLGVDTPASITNVQRVGFTSSPDISDASVFEGGACPASLGSSGDRCEKVTASIDLFVGTQFNVEEIQSAFQQGLEKGVARGRLQHFLKESYPQSIVTIASGQRVSSTPEPISASTEQEGDAPTSTEVAPGAITGIVLAIASGGLLTVLALVVTRRRRVKSNWKDDSIDVTVERASIDGKTLPEVTGLEWGPPEDIQYNEDIDDWSTPSMATGQPTVVIVGTEEHGGDYPQPLDDNFSMVSADEAKDAPSQAGSVTSGMHPGDRSAVSERTGHCSSLGSVSSTGFMSGNQIVDLHDGRLRDYIPGIADFDDLEAAILAGDWAALGATAAALASQNDGSVVSDRHTAASWDEESRDMSTRSRAWQDTIDANKAAELDQLIEQGNWAAIIEVAAKYEWENNEGNDTDHVEV